MYVTLVDNQSSTSSAPTPATGTITTVAVASLSDGEYFTITDSDGTAYVFEYDVSGNGVTAGRVQVDVSGDTDADDVRDTTIAAINASGINIFAYSGGAATVNLVSLVPDASAARTITENVSNGTFAVTGMSGAVDGVPLFPGVKGATTGEGLPLDHDECLILVKGLATAGAAGSIVLRLWGWSNVAKAWFPLGVGADADKGKLNNVAGTFTAMGEIGTNLIHHAEPIGSIRHFDRICCQRVTMTNIDRLDVYLVSRPGEG